ncbi:MAG: peptidoglycan DD-metalloendopeptidase family protein, partial [Pyrinomonadaceae bacterium]
ADSILGQLRKKQGTEPQTPALKNNAAAEAMRAIKTAAAEVTASPNVSGETRRADSLNDAPRAESLDPHAPVSKTNFRTSSGASLSSAADRYPDAVLISEASPASGPRFEPFSRNPARPKASANEAPLTDPALATRPRRVFPTPPDADVTSLPAARAFEAPGVAGGSHRPFEPVEFQMPVRGRVSSNFGTRRDPFHGRRRSHTGVDIVAPLGTPVGAAAHGTVVFAGRDGGYGNTVVLEHADGRRTRYAHAERLYVSAGEHVAAGQVIAAVGSTGRSTGPHLHFEVIERGRHANPLKALINASTLAGR